MAHIDVVTTEAIGLSTWNQAEASGAFAGFRHAGGGSPATVDETETFIQGTQAVSIKTSGTSRDEGLWHSDTAVDLTTNANKHVYVWAAISTMSQHATIAGGGLYIIVGSSTTNWNKYFVGGSDVSQGGFHRYVIDVNKTPSETSATPATLTAITHIGIGVKGTITAQAENVVVDRIDYGTGLAVERGQSNDPGTWKDVFAEDDDINNKWGIIEERSGVFYLKGGIRIGDASGVKDTVWADADNATVVFENPLYHNGDALVSAVTAADLYRIEIVGNGTGTTDVSWGEEIGAGDDRRGVLGGSIQSAGPKWAFDCDGDIADVDTVGLFGMQIQGAGICSFDVAAKTTIIGDTFVNCDQVEPNLATWLNNTIAAPVPDRGLLFAVSTTAKQTDFIYSSSNIRTDAGFVWQVDVSTTPDTYVDQTANFNGGVTDATIIFPATEAVGDYCAFGHAHKFARMRIKLSTAGVGGTVTWEYWNGSAWTALEDVVDATTDLTTSGTNDVDFAVPNDWAPVSINDESPLFYVRAVVATVYSTNPLSNGGNFRIVVEHMVNHDNSGTFAYDAMAFFGSGVAKFDVENSVAAVSVAIGAFANDDSDQIVGNGTVNGTAQSFAASAGLLSSITAKLSKLGAPTGNITAFLYAHSGTFGSSSVPTGAALATSDPIDIADIVAGADLLYKFQFTDEFTLVAATNYVFSIEFTGGDGSNHLIVRYDAGAATAGNKSTLNGSWAADAADDLVFQVARGGIVTIDASNGSDPAESESTGDPPGAVIINNPKAYTFVDLINGSEVRVFSDTNPPVELAGIESVVGNTFTYNHNGVVQNVYTTIQHIDYEWLRVNETLGATDLTTTIRQIPDDNFENP